MWLQKWHYKLANIRWHRAQTMNVNLWIDEFNGHESVAYLIEWAVTMVADNWATFQCHSLIWSQFVYTDWFATRICLITKSAFIMMVDGSDHSPPGCLLLLVAWWLSFSTSLSLSFSLSIGETVARSPADRADSWRGQAKLARAPWTTRSGHPEHQPGRHSLLCFALPSNWCFTVAFHDRWAPWSWSQYLSLSLVLDIYICSVHKFIYFMTFLKCWSVTNLFIYSNECNK